MLKRLLNGGEETNCVVFCPQPGLSETQLLNLFLKDCQVINELDKLTNVIWYMRENPQASSLNSILMFYTPKSCPYPVSQKTIVMIAHQEEAKALINLIDLSYWCFKSQRCYVSQEHCLLFFCRELQSLAGYYSIQGRGRTEKQHSYHQVWSAGRVLHCSQ